MHDCHTLLYPTLYLYHLLPLPPSRLLDLDAGGGMRFAGVFVLRDVRVGILSLYQVAEGVVYLAVFGFVGADVEEEVFHFALAFRHLPVADGNLGGGEVGPV